MERLGGPETLAGFLAVYVEKQNEAKPNGKQRRAPSVHGVRKWCERGEVPPKWHASVKAISEQLHKPLSFADLNGHTSDE